MDFVFLENASVKDEKSRKLIRSHCMKGKNAGKKRSRQAPAENSDAIQAVRSDIGTNESVVLAIQPVFAGRFSATRFPSHLDARMHELLYRCGLLQALVELLLVC
jgi:hypothetical protein